MNNPVFSSLLVGFTGLVVGFLAQRSRICFVAGLRDYILVRDRELLYGLFALLCTVWLLTSILYGAGLLRQGVPEYGSVRDLSAAEEAAMRLSAEARGERDPLSRFVTGLTGAGPVKRGIGSRFMAATLLGGFLFGLFSVFAGGCVLRQHVLCAQGQRNSLFYLIGFYLGPIVFYLIFYPILQWIY